MKSLALTITMITLLAFNGLGQTKEIKTLLDNPDTRKEVFNTIMNDHELMMDFITAMKGNEHASMMMKNNDQMMLHDSIMDMKGDHQMMDHKNMMGMMKNNPEMMQKMMGNGMCPMCGQMMGQDMPMQKYGMMVDRMPNMQQQLSLTDDQVEKLLDLRTSFKKQQLDYQAELRKKQMKMKSLLADNASASQVKNQMEACSETKINMKVATYETAGKMKALLNNDQKEQLQNTMMQQGEMMPGQGGMMNQGQGGMMQNKNNQ